MNVRPSASIAGFPAQVSQIWVLRKVQIGPLRLSAISAQPDSLLNLKHPPASHYLETLYPIDALGPTSILI